METFLPYVINKASRDKDESKVKTLGPYVYCLDYMIKHACSISSKEDIKISGFINLYRGTKLTKK